MPHLYFASIRLEDDISVTKRAERNKVEWHSWGRNRHSKSYRTTVGAAHYYVACSAPTGYSNSVFQTHWSRPFSDTPAHSPLRSHVRGYTDSVFQTNRSVLLCMRRRKPRLFGFQSGRKKLNYYREAGDFLFLYSKSIEHWLPFRHIRLT